MKSSAFSEPTSALECLVQATLEDDLAQKISRDDEVRNPSYNSDLYPPFARKCRNRECNNLSGQQGKPRSLYCSKRCQSREQNLRQGRIKNVKKVPKPFYSSDDGYSETNRMCALPIHSPEDIYGKRCYSESSPAIRGYSSLPLPSEMSETVWSQESVLKKMRVSDGEMHHQLPELHLGPVKNSFDSLYHTGKQLFELRSSEIESKTSASTLASIGAPQETPNSQAVSEILSTLPSIPETLSSNIPHPITNASVDQTSNLCTSTSSTSMNSTLLPSICSEHPKLMKQSMFSSSSKAEENKISSQICSPFALPSHRPFSNSEYTLITN